MPTYLGDARDSTLDPDSLDPILAEAWGRLQSTWADTPASEDVPTIADEILTQDPPLALALEAWRAKAAHAYLIGQDLLAIRWAEEGLTRLGEVTEAPPIERALREIALRAWARGGDPQQALAMLDDPEGPAVARSGLPLPELYGIRATALERDAQFVQAIAAYAQWRQSLADDGAAAAYVDARLNTLGRSLPRSALAEEAATLEPSLARTCLELLAGAKADVADTPGMADVPDWVRACAGPPTRVGVLLPRSGPLSALADAQLAAASVCAVTLGDTLGGVLWADAGSTPASAAKGARGLLDAGATVIVGPVGAANVRAARDAIGSDARLIVPGEALDGAEGVAPSLEARTAALVRLAKARGAKQIMVLVPDNGYGRRALAGIESTLSAKQRADLVVQRYPPDTTSFSPLLIPIFAGLRRGGALIVPDHVTRLEAVVRQMIRLERPPSLTAKEGVMLLSTAEGVGSQVLEERRKVFANVWVAPAAWGNDRSTTFEQTFVDVEGRGASDQELLVFRAFARAVGQQAREPIVTMAHVGEDGVVRTASK